MDFGSFVYHNDGVMWITDLGTEEYNVFEYFTSPTRYRYYRCNAEGNNLALVTREVDVPYGQFRSDVVAAEKYLEDGTAYGENFGVYYGLLSNIYFVYSALEQQLQGGGCASEIQRYEDMKSSYARSRSAVLNNSSLSSSLVRRLLGYGS